MRRRERALLSGRTARARERLERALESSALEHIKNSILFALSFIIHLFQESVKDFSFRPQFFFRNRLSHWA